MCDIHLVMFIIPKQGSNNKQDKKMTDKYQKTPQSYIKIIYYTTK